METDRQVRFEVWKQHHNTADAPYRRKHDRRYIFKWHQCETWSDVLPLIQRGQAVRIRAIYSRRFWTKGWTVRVKIGTAKFLKENR